MNSTNSFPIPKGYSFVKRIGHGSYGNVMIVADQTQNMVCIKSLVVSSENIRDLANELTVLARLRHPCIIRGISYA